MEKPCKQQPLLTIFGGHLTPGDVLLLGLSGSRGMYGILKLQIGGTFGIYPLPEQSEQPSNDERQLQLPLTLPPSQGTTSYG